MRNTIIATALIAMVAGCSTPVVEKPVKDVPAKPLGLPGKVVRTDGKGDIQVSAPGDAFCRNTSQGEAVRALRATNAARMSRGLPPVKMHVTAQKVAEAHACEMASRGVMTHKGRQTSGPGERLKQDGYKLHLAAENIAAGAFSFDRAVSEWTASPDHLANIMIPGISDFGVGYATAADGKSKFFAAVYAQSR